MKKVDLKYNQIQLFWSISVALIFGVVALQHVLNPSQSLRSSSFTPSPVATQFSPSLPAVALPDASTLR
jgi:hypothetical protein